VAIARTITRKLADELGYSMIDQVRMSTVIFEIAMRLLPMRSGRDYCSWREDNRPARLAIFLSRRGLAAHTTQTLWQTGENDSDILNIKKQADELNLPQDPAYGNSISLTIWLE